MSGAASERWAVVQWSADLTAEFVGTPPASVAACNSSVAEFVMLADRIVAGTAALDGTGNWIPPSMSVARPEGAVTGPVVGRYLTAADLTADTDRTQYALALAQCARAVHRAQLPVGAVSSGWISVLAQAGAVILVGIAAAWIVERASAMVIADRVRIAGIAGASRDYSERLRAAAATGQPLAAPSLLEVAAAGDVRAAAAEARSAGIGQVVANSVSKLTTGALVIAAVWVVGTTLKGK